MAKKTAAHYYQDLGLPRNSSFEKVKSVYRKLALQYHPDKNQTQEAREKFEQAHEAYDFFRTKHDENQKKMNLKKSEPPDSSASSSAGGDKAQKASTSHSSSTSANSNNFDTFLNAMFPNVFPKEDALKREFSNNQSFPYSRPSNNSNFTDPQSAGRCFPNAASSFCPNINPFSSASSSAHPSNNPEPEVHKIKVTLEEVLYGSTRTVNFTRKVYTEQSVLPRFESELIFVDIPRGIESGIRIVFPGKGDRKPNHPPEDLVFVVEEQPHLCFKRVDTANLLYNQRVTFADSVSFGCTFHIPTLDGIILPLLITDQVITPGLIKHFPNYGLPHALNPHIRGDLVVKFNVEYPRHFTLLEKRKLIQSLLHHPRFEPL